MTRSISRIVKVFRLMRRMSTQEQEKAVSILEAFASSFEERRRAS